MHILLFLQIYTQMVYVFDYPYVGINPTLCFCNFIKWPDGDSDSSWFSEVKINYEVFENIPYAGIELTIPYIGAH